MRGTLGLTLLLTLSACSSGERGRDEVLSTPVAQYLAHEVIVRPSPGVSRDDLDRAVRRFGGRLVDEESRVTRALGYYRVVLPARMVADEAISELVDEGVSTEAERNYVIEHMGDPDDASFDQLWGMRQIGAPAAWDYTTGSAEIVVAVTDTGVDATHPDLEGNLWHNPGEIPNNGVDDDDNGYIDDDIGYDFIAGDADPSDGHGHGSHVAGTIGATGNDGVGVVGVNWNVRIMNLQVLAPSGSGDLWAATSALLYAAENGARVVNASWGCAGCSVSYMRDAITTLGEAGCLFVAAAGNDGTNNDARPFYPASYELPNVISVAATNSDDVLASFSNYGAGRVHIAAPGVSILSTLPGGRYASWNGTSMAAPHVAGAAALYLSRRPGAPVEQVRERILSTAHRLGALSGRVETGGRLDVFELIIADGEPPAAPAELVAMAGDAGDIALAWNVVDEVDVDTYEIGWGVVSGDYTEWLTVPADEASAVVYPSELGVRWYFAVRAHDVSGNVGTFSAEANAVPRDAIAPPGVLDLEAHSTPGPRASGSVTDASGEYSDFYGAALAHDGSDDTSWVSPPRATPEQEWLTVALDEEAQVEAVELTPNASYPEFFPVDFDLEVSSDGVEWLAVAARRGVVVDAGELLRVALPPTAAAFVRLRVLRSFEHESGYFYASVADIAVYRASEEPGRIRLSFLAPGDDPGRGRADRYEVRYGLESFDASGFESATAVPSLAPNEAGALEELDVDGLEAETTYYFALRAVDEAGNVSPMSNVAVASTQVVPPGAITDLRVAGEGADSVTLGWSAPGGDGAAGRAAGYELRYAATPIDAASFADATEAVGLAAPLTAGSPESFVVGGLDEGTLYYFAIRATDDSGAQGGLSNVVTVIPHSGVDVTPPAATELSLRYGLDDVRVSLVAADASSEAYAEMAAANLVDGREATAWLSAWGAMDEPEWVVLDAGETRAFSRFRAYPDSFGAYLLAFPEDFQVQASVDGVTWTPIVDVRGFTAEHATWHEWRTPTVHARYLRLHTSVRGPMHCGAGETCAGGPVHIAEFEAHALIEERAADITWVAPGDDEWLGTAADYDLRRATTPLDEETYPSATPVATAVPSAAGSLEHTRVDGFAAESTYYFALRTRDEAGNTSALSNVATLITPPIPPAAVDDVFATDITRDAISLSFTATGDDGIVGTATSYELRYLTAPLGVDNWDFGYPVADAPPPSAPGTIERVTLSGLEPNTTYWVALKVLDDAGASSLLSNVLAVTTLDGQAPGEVADLVAAAVDPIDTSPLAVTITASSGSFSPETDAALAFDGDDDTLWMSPARATSTPEEVVLELGGERQLGRLRMRPAAAFVDLFPVDFRVEVQSGDTWLEVVRETGFSASGEWEEWALGSVRGTAVRLVVTSTGTWAGSHYAAIAEMELHEDPTDRSRVRLSWRAPGDDGSVGRASAYDLRVAGAPIDAVSFASASPVADAPAPSSAGTLERHEIDALEPETEYCFALTAMDEVGNESGVSNSACVVTGGLPPSTVTDLLVVDASADTLGLEWSAPGGRGTSGRADLYELRMSTERIHLGNWESAIVVPGLPTPAPYSDTQAVEVTGLEGLTTYFFALRSINEVGSVSPISNNAVGVTLDDVPPNAVTDVVVATDDTSTGALVVSFTAPGNSGPAGTASEYELRVSPAPLTEANFGSAERLVTSSPKASGETERVAAAGLAAEEEYYVAVIARDEAGNWSSLSNVAVGRTRDERPSPVADLAARVASAGSAPTSTLSWTAPGDDGAVGTAALYDVRYDTREITALSFASAAPLAMAPTPSVAGSSEVATVTGLLPGVRYWFVMKAIDERGNESSLSNQVSLETPDEIAPGAVTDLVATTAATGRRLDLRWTATGDDGGDGRAQRYHVRWSLTPIAAASWGAATEVTGEPTPGASGSSQSWSLAGLPDEALVHVALRVEDDAGNLSLLSNVASAETQGVDPARTTDLRQVAETASSVTLRWTAAGDDGGAGTATAYDLRYSTAPLTSANFAAATPVTTAPPAAAGTLEERVVPGLAPNAVYYVALQTVDERGGRSAMSNVVEVRTQDDIAPSRVVDLVAGTGVVAGSVVLDWTAAGDDGDVGQATRYELRRSGAPISAGTWAAATLVAIGRAPSVSGTRESVTLTGLAGERRYHFALSVVDDGGNESPISNSAGADTPPILPARIGDLVATASPGAVSLAFGAVGDDEMSGRATRYDIRYATSPITAANFDGAVAVSPVPVPGAPGSPEVVRVGALAEATSYWFAVVAIDDVGAASMLSNVATATTPDLTAPSAPSSFVVNAPAIGGTLLTSGGVVASSTLGSAWNAIYAVDRNELSSWASASTVVPTAVSLTTQLGGGATQIDRVRLLPDALYPELFPRGFRVEVSDGLVWSTVVEEEAFEATGAEWLEWGFPPHPAVAARVVATDTRASYDRYYAIVSEVEVYEVGVMDGQARLSWVAPGDDGSVGRASSYQVYRHSSALSEANIADAVLVAGAPAPRPAGSLESMQVMGLAGETPYFWAVRAVDDAGNQGPLSAVVLASTNDVPPATVGDLEGTARGRYEVELRWTAPGDDGHIGRAARYELRYAPWSITSRTFGAAALIDVPSPSAPGAEEALALGGLEAGTKYRVALIAYDEVDNASYLSNVAVVETEPNPDITAPAVVTDLVARLPSTGGLPRSLTADSASSEQAPDFGMDAVADGDPTTAWSTEARPIDQEEWVRVDLLEVVDAGRVRVWPSAAFVELFPRRFEVRGSPDGLLFETLMDASGVGADPAVAFEVLFNNSPTRFIEVRATELARHASGEYYAVVADIEVLTADEPPGTVTLSWTAPGDDGTTGQAASYDLRRSACPYDDAGSISVVAWAPNVAGAPERLRVPAVPSGEQCFRVRTSDEVPNESGLSNVASVLVP